MRSVCNDGERGDELRGENKERNSRLYYVYFEDGRRVCNSFFFFPRNVFLANQSFFFSLLFLYHFDGDNVFNRYRNLYSDVRVCEY